MYRGQSVCVCCHERVNPANTAESSEMPFGAWTHEDPKKAIPYEKGTSGLSRACPEQPAVDILNFIRKGSSSDASSGYQ